MLITSCPGITTFEMVSHVGRMERLNVVFVFHLFKINSSPRLNHYIFFFLKELFRKNLYLFLQFKNIITLEAKAIERGPRQGVRSARGQVRREETILRCLHNSVDK
jgi:hypothetical protein